MTPHSAFRTPHSQEALPPHCPEAERGVLGCCLLDLSKASAALKAGVSTHWFFDARHAEIFAVLAGMVINGGGDAVVATLLLRERGKLDAIGGPAYLNELQNAVPSAENFEYYLPELQDRFRRRQVLDAATRLKLLAQDFAADSAAVLSDTEALLETLHNQADSRALPEIVCARDLLESDIPTPGEVVAGVLHQGSKLILGGSSKSYKTWTLTSDYRVLLPKMLSRIKDEGHTLVILDPTYKLLGASDENSASDISGLLNTVEGMALATGAAVAMAGHFAKGNASAKEAIDRISGSGVFARDPDSLVIFTKHEEEGAFTVETVLRNFPPVAPFVVQWKWPLFQREAGLDPAKLKSAGGRPPIHTTESLLECLGGQRLRVTEWSKLAKEEHGVPNGSFFTLLKQLVEAGKVQKSAIDSKWERLQNHSKTCPHPNDQ